MYSLFYNKNIFYGLFNNIKLSILNSMVMLPFAIMLAIVFIQYSYFGILLFIVPVILARYTFSLYIDSKSQYIDTVDALMRAMEARDKYTEGHSQRVAELVKEIAKELKYNDWTIDKLNIASLLHDVGKIGIDDCILNKPGKLTDEEYDIIKSHPEIGYGILKDVKNLKDIIHIVKHHHERYDGKGYPDGMSGDELNLDVYIVQLADCVDAMTTDRPYRKALTLEQVISELENNSGTQFHPKVVDAYLNLLKKQNKNIQG
jgi:putative nucleotidyltransferase with HDIG domain